MVLEWQHFGALVAVLSPLVGAPLMMITFYLRAMRDHQNHTLSELAGRMGKLEQSLREMVHATGQFEREYTTKEEWVRESMLTRQRLESLTEMVTRIEVELENGHGVAAEVARATSAIVDIVRQLSTAQAESNGPRRQE